MKTKAVFGILLFFFCVIFSNTIFAQRPQIIVDEKTGEDMLVGQCQRADIEDESPFNEWFKTEYSNYNPDTAYLKRIGNRADNIRIVIILGTWCSDSREQLPRFFKVLDKLNYNPDNLTLIAVDRNKTAPEIQIDEFNIQLVPVFIFYRNETEIGRVIETPAISLEADMMDIINR